VDVDNGMITCTGGGLCLTDSQRDPPDQCNDSGEFWYLYSDLLCITVAEQVTAFIHMHAVDTYEAQHIRGTTRNITVAFGLIGLYLALEKSFTGRQIQLAHQQIARIRKDRPRIGPPVRPAGITVRDVLQAETDAGRDAMIRQWMEAVWASWEEQQVWVRETTDELVGWYYL
jgi:hypothetical protein